MSLVMLQRQINFWYWHLLYWLSYLLIKYVHLATLVPLQDEPAWPYLWIYTLVTAINFVVTGVLGQFELRNKHPLFKQLTRLLLVLIPLWLCMVILRQSLVMSYTANSMAEVDSALKYLVAFSLVLLPLAGWLAVFMLIKANQLHYAGFVQQQALSQRARQARLKVLRYQLNPHFMFNTLNALNSLIVQRDGNAAEQLIEHLSTYLRHSLKNQHDNLVPLQQELDALQAYMAIQQIRFGSRLSLRWHMPEPLPQLHVPPLLLQPLAENAIQFSVAEQSGKVVLEINLVVEAALLVISLTQQGASYDGSWPLPQHPANLLNLAERLQLLFADRAHLRLSLNDSGFYSQIQLPKEALDGST